MSQDELARLSREELIELTLEKNAGIEAMKMKVEKGKKPPTTGTS
jgi:hypothetical protein